MSAIPEPDPVLARTKQHIPLRSEDIPSLLALPAGCSFHPRCPWHQDGLCDMTVPPLDAISANHDSSRVACLRVQAGEQLAVS
jgi:ABC-type dipeptide/oligopeptide/nickel transport system ATPase component